MGGNASAKTVLDTMRSRRTARGHLPPCGSASGEATLAVDMSHVGLELQNRYILDEMLARGRIAIVYRGRDTVLRRPIAVKVIAPDLAPRYRSALHETASLTHPAVVALYDALEQDGWLFLVQEFVPGRPLASYVRTGLTVERSVDIVGQIARALAYAHSHGVVHGDLTPDAILVDRRANVRINNFALPPDQTYLADLAALLEHDASSRKGKFRTTTSAAVITDDDPTVEANSVSAEPAPPDDIRAAGLLLRQLLSESSGDQRPFRPEVPDTLRALVQRCVVREHGDPIADAESLVLELEAVADGLQQQRPANSEPTPPALRAAHAETARSAPWSEEDTLGGAVRWTNNSTTGMPGDAELDFDPQVSPRREPIARPPVKKGSPAQHRPTRPIAESALYREGAVPYREPAPPPRWPTASSDYHHVRVRSKPPATAGSGISLTVLLAIGVALFLLFFVVGVLAPPIFGQ
jgi:serine/threonine protein kinase